MTQPTDETGENHRAACTKLSCRTNEILFLKGNVISHLLYFNVCVVILCQCVYFLGHADSGVQLYRPPERLQQRCPLWGVCRVRGWSGLERHSQPAVRAARYEAGLPHVRTCRQVCTYKHTHTHALEPGSCDESQRQESSQSQPPHLRAMTLVTPRSGILWFLESMQLDMHTQTHTNTHTHILVLLGDDLLANKSSTKRDQSSRTQNVFGRLLLT